jgi:hypothetical protein
VRVPVIIFDPSRPIVWQLRKPWEPLDQGPAPPPLPASVWPDSPLPRAGRP